MTAYIILHFIHEEKTRETGSSTRINLKLAKGVKGDPLAQFLPFILIFLFAILSIFN